MERAVVMQRLAQAERHAADGEKHVARQRDLVAEIGRDGHDTELALMLLIRFEELQALNISDRDRLRAELAELK